MPVQLPVRYDGQPIRHLSPSSYGLWVTCREAWRRKYICGEREAPSGAMFLGSRVDDAVSLYYRGDPRRARAARPRTGQGRLPRPVASALDAEQEKLGVNWADIHQQAAFELGLEALELTFEPAGAKPRRAGRSPATAGVQAGARAGMDDPLLPRPRNSRAYGTGEPIERVVDYKVKDSPISQPQADRDPQASLYLTGAGWRAGPPRSSPLRRSPNPAYVDFHISRAMLREELCCAASGMSAGWWRSGPPARHIPGV